MNLMDLFIRIGVDDQATSKISKISASVGKGLASAAKIGVAAIGAASTAIIGLGKIGLDYNKQMETYTTNFEVMMGDAEAAAKKVEELKEMGAKTPFELGDLANATQTLLAFNVSADDSTGVLQKLGDISLGNAQKLETLTRAYGKMNSSQKVTLEDVNMMIDSGFNPLLLIAEDTGETMEELYDRISKGAVSFEEMEKAINKATSAGGQFYQGMQKASQTTEGLISTLKDNATALVGEVFMPISEGLQKTVLPSAIDAISTLSEAFKKNGVDGMISAAGEMLGSLVNSIVKYAPKVVDTAVTLVNSLIKGLSDNQESIAMGAVEIITALANGILSMLPQIVKLGLDLIVSLALGIAESLPELIPTIIDVVMQIVTILTSPDMITNMINAGIQLILGLVTGLIMAIPKIVEALPTIITNLISGLLNAIPLLVDTGIQLIVSLVSNLPAIIAGIVKAVPEIIMGLINAIINFVPKLAETGLNLIKGLWNGIKNAGTWLWDKISGFFGGIVDRIKNFFGIKSPSRLFRDEIGKMLAQGIGVGFDDEFADVKSDMEKAMAFDDVEVSANVKRSGSFGGVGSKTFGDVHINIDGARYNDEQSLAVEIAERLQHMADRKVAVYA